MSKYIMICALISLVACTSEQKPSSKLPADPSAMPDFKPLNAVKLQKDFSQKEGKTIWVFSSPNDPKAYEMIKTMEDVIEESQLKVEVINILVSGSEKGIEGLMNKNRNDKEVMWLAANELRPADFDSGWNGDLPAILIRDSDQSLTLFYQQYFSKEEFFAILQTVTF